MDSGVWALAAFAFVLHAALTWRLWLRAKRLQLGLRLVERRESLNLEAIKALGSASQRSSQHVLAALDRAVRERSPSIDAVIVLRKTSAEFVPLFVSGARCEAFEGARFPALGVATPLTQAVALGHRVALEPPLRPLIPTDRGALAVPLGGVSAAVVYVSTADRRRIANADGIVQVVEQAAAPFEYAREREAFRSSLTYEGLTGLLTARAFWARLTEEVRGARIRGGQLGVWFIDADNFKRVNDTHGHPSGDLVLQGLGRLVSAHLVSGLDIVARNGGDEFCALLFNAQKRAAIARAHRFCESVAADFDTLAVPITVSVGVASFPTDAGDASELLTLADAAMYHSKRCGRNRVSFTANGVFEVFDPSLSR